MQKYIAEIHVNDMAWINNYADIRFSEPVYSETCL